MGHCAIGRPAGYSPRIGYALEIPISRYPPPSLFRRDTEPIPKVSRPINQTQHLKMKSHTKNELAQAAGVCTDTFRRWLKSDQAFLQANGITPTTKIFPPKVVKYLCEKYCIDLKD